MARTGQVKKVGTALAGVLTISLIAGVVFGEGTSPAAPAAPIPPVVAPAPFSPECQGGSTEIVTESPLPHVAAALMKRRTVRILAIGNSTGRRQGGFTRQIERLLKQVVKGADVVIINRGVSGELAANASLRIKNEVAMSNPDLVIWQVGTDDALAFVPLDEVRETVESTVRWLKEHNVDVVLAGLQYVERVAQDDNYYRTREMLRDVAAKEHVMIIRRYEAMQFIAAAQDAGGGYGPDEFERTEAGYNCLAQYLASAITVGAFGKGMSARPLRGPPGSQPQQPPQQAQPPQQQRPMQ
ncbi:MAG: SGNH/GDSL hydrolase family protein [Xanthobacteraceae bacterium]|nr:SGNH/GDSL hydrolase family protein [Xanthobacteraceae bacterium]